MLRGRFMIDDKIVHISIGYFAFLIQYAIFPTLTVPIIIGILAW